MSSNGNDTLMRMVISSGVPLRAECQTEVTRDDDEYVEDYYNGQFFEIDEFRFNLKVTDGKKTADKSGDVQKTQGATATTTQGTGAKTPANRIAPPAAKDKPLPGEIAALTFSKWRSMTPDEVTKMMKTAPYPVEMGEVSIERTFDKASPILFDYCCNSKTFESASMIKRKDTGDVFLRGFLRFDFQEVLVTSVEWKNGEVMKETFTFVFRHVQVRYRTAVYQPGQVVATLKDQPAVIWDYTLDLKASGVTE